MVSGVRVSKKQIGHSIATAMVIVMREADTESISGTNTASQREVHIQRHGRPAPKQPSLT